MAVYTVAVLKRLSQYHFVWVVFRRIPLVSVKGRSTDSYRSHIMSMDVARLSYEVTEPSSQHGSKLSPIIMLHGMTYWRQTWKFCTQKLADETGRKVYILDARNHGDSEWKTEHNEMVMAKDLSYFMEQHGITTAIIVGHSMGAKVAMYFATKEPEKVEKLVFEDLSPKLRSPNTYSYAHLKTLRDSLTSIPPETDLESAKTMVVEYIKANTAPEHIGNLVRFQPSSYLPLQKTADGFSWKINIDAIEKIYASSDKPGYVIEGFYRGPCLFICGTESIYDVAGDKEHILSLFPDSTFKAVEGANHHVHAGYPNEFLEAVLDFIK